jgi:hypothetical protein
LNEMQPSSPLQRFTRRKHVSPDVQFNTDTHPPQYRRARSGCSPGGRSLHVKPPFPPIWLATTLASEVVGDPPEVWQTTPEAETRATAPARRKKLRGNMLLVIVFLQLGKGEGFIKCGLRTKHRENGENCSLVWPLSMDTEMIAR